MPKNVLPQTNVKFALLSGWQLAVFHVCVCVCVVWVGGGLENETTVRVQPNFRGCVVSTQPRPGGPVADAGPEGDREECHLYFFLACICVFLLCILQVGIRIREPVRCSKPAVVSAFPPLICAASSEPHSTLSRGRRWGVLLLSPWDERRLRLVCPPWSL